MKQTKEILDLVEKRRKYGNLANAYDSKVQQWCRKHDINDMELLSDYGCMVISEPDCYAEKTIKLVEES